MFCSKCGKTIHNEDVICPSCGAAIGNNRFGGISYTSAQFTIAPGQTDFEPQTDYEPQNNYTRTSYTQMENAAQEDGEVDSRTTYRPVYEENNVSIPDELRQQMRETLKKSQAAANGEAEPEAQTEDAQAPIETETVEEAPVAPARPLSAAAKERLDEIDEKLQPDEGIDLEQFRRRPIETRGRAGISEDVSEYIRKLENGQGRRASRRRETVYDDYAEPAEATDTDAYAAMPDDDRENYTDDENFEEIPEEEYDDEPRERSFGVLTILKVLGALVLAAAIAFGVIKGIGYVRGKQPSAPIEGVSQSLYDEGIALLKSHTEGDYINSLISKYTTDGIISMSTALANDSSAINALMPETPAANDETFMSALQTIQGNIGSAVTMDALAVGSASETAVADSEARWQIVNNSITQLEGITSAAELTGIINGQTITVQTETPEPTQAAPTYATLQKGDESNDVLALQLRLYALGYLNDKCDGSYGSKTQTAVKFFQETAGLNPTGIADNDTQAALNAEDAPYAPGAATPTPGPQATPEPVAEPVQEPVQQDAPADDPLESI